MIEDNHAFRQTVARLLNQTQDIRCTQSFPACEDALALMNTGGTMDVILLDVELSGMNGIEGLRNLRRRAQELHGAVRFLSTPGQGTRVEFEAPFPRMRGFRFPARTLSSP